MSQELLTPVEAAERLRTPEATMQWWRTTGRGPRYVKLGRRVFYRLKDLEEFVTAGEHVSSRA